MHPLIIFAGFFFFAVTYNLLGPLAPNIMTSTGMTLTDSGTLVSFQQIGSFIAIVLSLWLMKHVKQTTVMRLGFILLITSLMIIALSSGTFLLFILYTLLGAGAFFFDSGTNATIAGNYFEKRSTYIPLLHFSYSVGAIATGYIVLPFKGSNWRWAYALVGVILLIIFIGGILDQKKRKRNADIRPIVRIPNLQSPPVQPLLKDPSFIIYTLVIALYMGSQIICSAWIPVYVELELGQSPSITAMSLSLFWVGTAASRLLIGPIMNAGGKPFTLSILGTALAGVALFFATITTNLPFILICIALCGFFAGSTIPMYIVVTSTWFPQNTAFISLSYLLSGTIGRMIFPWLVTKIAATSSLGYSLGLSSILLIGAALLILLVKKISRSKPAY